MGDEGRVNRRAWLPVPPRGATLSAMSDPPADAREGLPLTHRTPAAWADAALADPLALLVDHAHCEEKAASMALRLLARFPQVAGLPRRLLALVHEELRHFRGVVDELEARGGALTPPQRDRYAGRVRALSCGLPDGLGDPGDLLLACAFIEARSCERFRLLAAAAAGRDARLATFYRQLADAEARHWELFRDLAGEVAGAARVARRVERLAEAEGALVASLPPGPRIH